MSDKTEQDIFADATDEGTTGVRVLEGSAQLTQISNTIAARVFAELEGNMEERREQVVESQQTHAAMDALVAELGQLEDVDVEFLKALPEATINGLLKSQQSKRSRTKNKTMTLTNYRTMMAGAIAEALIRMATNKPKLAGGSRRAAGDIVFTDEQMAYLAEHQDELRRELRNVQSKKSIAKSKDNFDEDSELWQALLVAEAQLKGARVAGVRSQKVVEVDTTKDALAELIALNLKPAEFAKRAAALTQPAEPEEAAAE